MTLQNILDDYYSRPGDSHIIHCKNQTTLSSAIYVAASALNELEEIHGHQKRVGYKASKQFALHLLTAEHLIKNARDFEELLKIVSSNRTHRIGALAIYDAAERIGIFLGILPTKIYLHCGSKEGAAKLLAPLKGKKSLNMTDLPIVWQQAGLMPQQIENIFCIYKKHLHLNLR